MSLGAFFEVDRHDADAVPQPPWRPLTELLDDAAVLDDRVEQVRLALARAAARPPAQVARRVAASVAHLGLVARIISPAFATAVESGQVAYLALDQLWWQAELGGAFPLSTPRGSISGAGLGPLVDGPLAELTDAVCRRFAVADRVLWGNVASAINGAAVMFGRARPDYFGAARSLATDLLARPMLAAENGEPGPQFRRRSCCLIYQVSPAGRAEVCGDCVLAG